MVLLRPALVARGVVSVGAGVLVVVVRGVGGAAGRWAVAGRRRCGRARSASLDPGAGGGWLLRPSTMRGGAVFPAVRGSASPASPRSFGRDDGSDRDLSW